MRIAVLGVCGLLCALGHASGWAAAEPSSRAGSAVADLVKRVQSDTEQLTAAVRQRPDENLLEIAEHRQAAMSALMERAPDVALQHAYPAERRRQLPPDVRGHVEELVTINGTLELLGSVGEDGRLGYEHYLEVGDTRLRLFTERLPDDFITGAVVTVDGLRLADRLAADPEGITLVEPSGLAPGENANGADGVRYARALVININFSDLRTQPWTIARANDIFNGQITPWFDEVSYQHFSFDADIAGWYTISASSRTCATNTFRDQAEAAARADGFNPSQYQHVVIAFPRVAACNWAGLGQVPGRYTWLNNAMGRGTAVHELGHNLGLAHSHSIRCNAGPLDGSCASTEYGDRFDVMGSGGNVLSHTNSYHGTYKNYLGWIPNSDVISITEADVAAEVTISSVESPEGFPRVLRVKRPGSGNEFFTIEMREPIGEDAGLAAFPFLTSGVAVYLGTSTRNQSVIDVAYTTATRDDAPLQVGDTLYVPGSDLNITPLSVGDGQATIYVSYVP